VGPGSGTPAGGSGVGCAVRGRRRAGVGQSRLVGPRRVRRRERAGWRRLRPGGRHRSEREESEKRIRLSRGLR
jgi:hypothetical protein